MALRRLTSLIKKDMNIQNFNQNRSKFAFVVLTMQMRGISSLEITKNISLISEEKKDNKVVNLKLEKPEGKPLVVMLSWLMARKKHIYKYANIYLKQGFDVLNISITPMQLLWPIKGAQVVAKDVLKFLDTNTCYRPLIVHGFSVGGYVWGELLVHVAAEQEKYKYVVDRIAGQIWDSAADVTEIPVGLPIAVFPRNTILQNVLRQYILYHMKTFDKVATAHYIRASQMFHTSAVKAPAQIFISKTDPIGTESSNGRLRENLENMGIRVYWKCWEKSPHVGHFRMHQEEYLHSVNTFLEDIKLSDVKQKRVTAKL